MRFAAHGSPPVCPGRMSDAELPMTSLDGICAYAMPPTIARDEASVLLQTELKGGQDRAWPVQCQPPQACGPFVRSLPRLCRRLDLHAASRGVIYLLRQSNHADRAQSSANQPVFAAPAEGYPGVSAGSVTGTLPSPAQFSKHTQCRHSLSQAWVALCAVSLSGACINPVAQCW
jgi:hypothetical protein